MKKNAVRIDKRICFKCTECTCTSSHVGRLSQGPLLTTTFLFTALPPPHLHRPGISVTSQDEVESILPRHGGVNSEERVSCLLKTHGTTQVSILASHLDEELCELSVEPPLPQDLRQKEGGTQSKVHRPMVHR